jgi:replicative DNA helicase
VELKTEDATLETSLIYSFYKYGEEALNAAKKYINEHDFIISTNRKIAKIIFSVFTKHRKIPSIKGTYKLFCSRPDVIEEDKAAIKYALEKISESSIELSDVPVFSEKLKTLACQRQFVKKVKGAIEDMKTADFSDVLTDFSRETTNIMYRMDEDLQKNTMFFKRDVAIREKYFSDIANDEIAAGLVYTGFRNLDKFMPALGRGTLAIYQARVNVGKSMALLHTAIHNHMRGLRVIIITIEMSALEYCMRIDSKVSRILHSKFSRGMITKDKDLCDFWKEKVQTFAMTNDNDIAVYWVPSGCTPEKVEMIVSTNPFPPDLVVVDYAGDMEAGVRGVIEFTPQAQAHTFKALKQQAGRFGCVYYTAQQIKRGVKKIDTESGAMTQVAANKSDLMMVMEESRADMCDEGYNATTSKSNKDEEKTEESTEENKPQPDKTHDGKLTITVIKNRNATKNMIVRPVKRFAKMTFLDEPERDFILYANGDTEYPDETEVERGPSVDDIGDAVHIEDENLQALM